MPTPTPSADGRDSVLDIDAQQVGSLYAKALLATTEKAGQTEAVLEELDALVTDILDHQPKFESVLASGVVPAEEVAGVIDKAFGGKVSKLFLSFLKVLARHGRLNSLRAVRQAAHVLHNELRGRVAVRMTTATEAGAAMATLVANAIRGTVGKEPVIESRVDPDLIGGVVLQIGDTVYDGSVATQFQRLRARMLDRSVHEIQSRRDRFSSPGGD
jgi:F-type H+-transporting ATPase subunit delta